MSQSDAPTVIDMWSVVLLLSLSLIFNIHPASNTARLKYLGKERIKLIGPSNAVLEKEQKICFQNLIVKKNEWVFKHD